MSNQDQPLELPTHYIEIGKSFVKAHGIEQATIHIQNKILALEVSLKHLPNEAIGTKMNIAQQIDFWSQTKQSI
jgi:hypothetical protein